MDIAKILLDAGAQVDATRPADGSAPLVAAAENGHADVVALLLNAGAVVRIFPAAHVAVCRKPLVKCTMHFLTCFHPPVAAFSPTTTALTTHDESASQRS